MEWLQDETEYYARAYAINDIGASYGNEVKFTTSKVILEIECEPETNSVEINSTKFNSVETGWDVPLVGNYGLEGHSLNIDFSIGFEFPPRSGVYNNGGMNTPIGISIDKRMFYDRYQYWNSSWRLCICRTDLKK